MRYRAHVDAAVQRLHRSAPTTTAWAAVAPLDRAGPAARAAAPGADPHRHPACAVAATRCCRPMRAGAAAAAGARRRRAGSSMRGGERRGRPCRRRLRLRQRDAAPRGAAAAVRDRRPAGDLRRVRRRSSTTAATARPELWLSDGWAAVQAQGWRRRPTGCDRRAAQFTPARRAACAARGPTPVTHLSFYEAAAYAEWAGARLPTEFEWEAAVARPARRRRRASAMPGNGRARPTTPTRAFGRWPAPSANTTASSWSARSCCAAAASATPPGHARPSYRNFFPPAARWQFCGLRLAKDV